VPRYNFYLRHGYQRPNGGLGRRVLHYAARARARRDFYGFDIERRAVDLLKKWRNGMARQQPPMAED
jgi:hypothetical protein